MLGIQKEVRAVRDCHLTDDCRSQRHLDALNRVEAQQPELTIEVVEIQHRFERRPRQESLRRELLQRAHIDEQPVIADVLEGPERADRVAHAQPATLQVREQRCGGQRRFGVRGCRPGSHVVESERDKK